MAFSSGNNSGGPMADINVRFDTFAHDLHDFFATGSRVR